MLGLEKKGEKYENSVSHAQNNQKGVDVGIKQRNKVCRDACWRQATSMAEVGCWQVAHAPTLGNCRQREDMRDNARVIG